MAIQIKTVRVDPRHEGQRLDNYLARELRGVPRSALYRLIRKGQVRVNGGRCKPMQKLLAGDQVRIPMVAASTEPPRDFDPALLQQVRDSVVYADNSLKVLNKPAGLAVHGGSGLRFGLVDLVKTIWPGEGWELVHRLDRETSGCLLLARGLPELRRLQQLFSRHKVNKTYLTLLKGRLPQPKLTVEMSLSRSGSKDNLRQVRADPGGKPAVSRFTRLQHYSQADFCQVHIATGRTHQIRVHAAEIGHPLAGDQRYGERQFNRDIRRLGLKRLFLHAAAVEVPAENGENLTFHAPLPDSLSKVLDGLQ